MRRESAVVHRREIAGGQRRDKAAMLDRGEDHGYGAEQDERHSIPLEKCDAGATAAVDGMRWASRRSRKRPKRATTNPKPMMVRPVRIHARRVRSAAKKTRGSDM